MAPGEWIRYQFDLELVEEGLQLAPREWRDREIERRIDAMSNTRLLRMLDSWHEQETENG